MGKTGRLNPRRGSERPASRRRHHHSPPHTLLHHGVDAMERHDMLPTTELAQEEASGQCSIETDEQGRDASRNLDVPLNQWFPFWADEIVQRLEPDHDDDRSDDCGQNCSTGWDGVVSLPDDDARADRARPDKDGHGDRTGELF